MYTEKLAIHSQFIWIYEDSGKVKYNFFIRSPIDFIEKFGRFDLLFTLYNNSINIGTNIYKKFNPKNATSL